MICPVTTQMCDNRSTSYLTHRQAAVTVEGPSKLYQTQS